MIDDKNILPNEVLDRPSASSTTSDYKKIKNARLTNIATADDNINFSEPASQESADVLTNEIKVTASGHVIEFDDTAGAERICIFHKSGHFIEMTNDHVVTKVFGQDVSIVLDNSKVYIAGSQHVTIEGDCHQLVKGSLNQKVNGDYNLRVKGNMNTYVHGNKNEKVNGTTSLESMSNFSHKINAQSITYATGKIFIQGETIDLNKGISAPSSLTLTYGLNITENMSLSQPSAHDVMLNKGLQMSLLELQDASITYPKDRVKL